MMPIEDIHLQLVDLPPLSSQHVVTWLGSTLQSADAALLVVDISDPEAVQQVEDAIEVLKGRRVRLTGRWPATHGIDGLEEGEDPFGIVLPVVLLANKSDLDPDSKADVAALEELLGLDYPALVVSAESGAGLDRLGPWLVERLGIVRVYTKAPGKPADSGKPFTVRRGETVGDVARLVHRELAESIKFARLWNASHQGQHVGRDHAVEDGDVIELHD
jgi:ribosome-interacting GTPase 1